MRLPIKITTQSGVQLSDEIQAEIQRRAEALDRYCDRIMSCRVVIDAPILHHKNKSFAVRIDLTVPNGELVVDRQHDADLMVALRDSFDSARRQLEDYVRRVRGDVKSPSGALRGLVVKLFPEKGYGFVRTPDGQELYFHRNSVLGNGFDELRVGAEVRFAEEAGQKGPQASTVALAERPHF